MPRSVIKRLCALAVSLFLYGTRSIADLSSRGGRIPTGPGRYTIVCRMRLLLLMPCIEHSVYARSSGGVGETVIELVYLQEDYSRAGRPISEMYG